MSIPITASFFFMSSLTLNTMGIGSTRMAKSARTPVYFGVCQCMLSGTPECRLSALGRTTYEKSQKHRDSLHTAVAIVRFNEHCDWVTCKEMRKGKANGPANNVCKNDVYHHPELANVKDVLVHD